jgi:hypothetical protein
MGDRRRRFSVTFETSAVTAEAAVEVPLSPQAPDLAPKFAQLHYAFWSNARRRNWSLLLLIQQRKQQVNRKNITLGLGSVS